MAPAPIASTANALSVNDSYFWVVSQFSNLDVKNALKGHTTATFFQGLVGIGIILLLHQIIG